MNSWQKVNRGQMYSPVQIKSNRNVENRKEENLRISGEKIMRTAHNATVKKRMLRGIKQLLASVFISMVTLSTAYAFDINGKVYLDYDNTASKTEMPLTGLKVELYDSNQKLLSDAITNQDGSYKLDAPFLGTYKVVAKTTEGETIDRSVQLIVDTGASAQNLFIKGQGGDINLAIKDDKGAGAKNIPVRLIYSASSKTPIFVTSNGGTVELKNTLKGHQYDMVVDAEDFITDSSNKIKYALWDATLPDSKNAYVDKISFNMAGKNQKGVFNVKPRNEWGVDGIVAIDQNGDGIYTVDFDTGAIDMNVELYYPGTTTKVLGTKTMTTTDDGRYRFKDLAVASYDIRVTNVKAPYIPISKIEQNVKITDVNNQTSGPTFLLRMDPNDTTLVGISGNVFVLGPQQYIQAGPDSGKTGNNIPLVAQGSTGLNTTVELYQHNGTNWNKIASQFTTGNLGAYQFVGLIKNKDYKVVVTESNINLNENIFVNDTDGKSTSTSSKSRSTHKGKVTLSNGTQANIAAKEIILPKLNEQKTNQNFWYSPIRKDLGNLLVVNYLKTANGNWSWSSTINGLEAITASTYTKIAFFEEDGVTQATDLQGNKLEVSYQKPGFYGVRGSQDYPIDHAGLFYYSVVEYDTDNLDYPESYNGEYSVNVAPAKTWGDTIYFTPTRPNTISGYVYLNNSHRDALGSYNPNQDIPIKQNRLILEREVFGEWTVITEFATDNKGHYNFTNLPNGKYRVTAKQEYGGGSDIRNGDIDFENNDQNSGSSIDPNDNKKTISSIVVNANGGNKYNTDTNIWYKLKINQHILRGSVFLDTWLGDGEIQTEQMYNANDLPLKNAVVLLCEDDGTSDCIENGSNFIGKKLTNAKGEYSFQGQQDGINRDVTYIVKAIYSGTTAVNNPDKELAPSYKVQFKQLDMPLTKRFLMQGKGQFSAAPVNDLNGDMKYAGEQTIENGNGYFQIYFWNGINYEKWGDIGDYYRTIKLKSLPKGKYRIVHNQGENFIDIADMDPVTPPGTVDFEVLADGSLANNLGKNNLFLMQAQVASSNTTEAISGKLYLDVTGSKNKDEAVELTKEELIQYNKSMLTVSGIFTPRIYPGYFNGNVDDILDQVDFIDKSVQYTGEFAYTAANSTRGKLYLTNMLLRLTGLDTSQFELVGNSGQLKGDYLPTKVQTNLEYMQVAPSGLLGAPDQYWLVKLKNDTEISGRLYYDYDDDGFFTPGTNDVVISGVTVELYRNGKFYAKTKTDKSGLYNFKNLFNDTYTVKVTEQGLDKQRYELKSVLNTVADIAINEKTPKVTGDNLDFIYKKNGDAAITGHVMVDINNNGTLENNVDKTGDMAIPDINVKLYKFDGTNRTFYREVKTNAKGYYSFSGIDLNTDYIVEIEPTKGFGVIANAEGNTNINLKPIHFEDVGKTVQNQYFLLAGSSNSSPSAGIGSNKALNSGIAGKTIIDGDGTSSELPIDNVLIGLIDSNGTEIARQYTNSKGEYHFYNLPSGKFSINVVTSPDGYTLVKNSKGTTQPIDTLSGLDLTNVGIKDNNFYFKQASDEGIGGKIYVDYADNNTDFNQLNVFAYLLDNKTSYTVELRDGLDGTGKLLMTQQTVDGEYHFSNLVFGDNANYSVVLKLDANADHAFKQSSAGNDPKNIVIPVASLPKQGSPDNYYLLVGKQKIGGYVWVDENESKDRQDDEGLNGINVTLNYQAPGATDYVELKKVNTDNSGHYQFEKLPKGGNYQIKVSTQEGTQLIAESVMAGNSDSYAFTPLTKDELTNSTAYKYNGTIKGHVSIDVDNSQTRTAIDENLSGLTLKLTKTNGATTKQVTTDNNGNFEVDNLSFDDWVITADSSQSVADWSSYQLSYTQTGNKAVAATAKDLSLTVNLSKQNPAVSGVEIGYHGSAVIKGYVVIDADNDGKYSANDIAFGALSTPITPKLVLTSAKSGFVEQEIKVDARTGLFVVSGLSRHDYVLKIDDKAIERSGYRLVFSPNSTTVSNQVTFSVNSPKDDQFSAGNVAEQQAFGFKSENVLKGTIYKDYSGQGTHQTYHTATLSGVKVVATNSHGLTLTVDSDSKGEYEIANIGEGSWTITVEAPANSGYDFSYVVQKVGGEITTINKDSVVVNIPPASSANKIKNVDFGLKGQASIDGQVVIDVNADDGEVINTQDIGIDTLFANYKVELYVDNNLVKEVKAVSTGSTETELGNYRFDNLVSGVDYQVKVSRPVTDYVSSFMLIDSSHPVVLNKTDSEMSEIYQFAGATDKATGVSFAWKGSTSIKGKIYLDSDDNGVYNASTDSSVNADLTVKLSNINNPALQITQTIAAGETVYELNSMIPGKWQIEVEGVPSTLRASFDPDDPHHDSKGQLMLPKTSNMATVEITGNLTDQDFGYIHGGIIEGKLVEDREGKGLSGLSELTGLSGADVYLLDNTQKHLMNKEGKPLSFMTSSDGKFIFRNLVIDPNAVDDPKYSIRLLFGEYHDGVVGSDKTNPLYEKVPYFEQYIDNNGKEVKHDLIDIATPPASIVYNGSGGMQTLPIKLNDGSTTYSATSNDIILGYRVHNADVTVIKTALKDNVVVGDIVPYTIKVINNSSHKSRIKVKDILPSGFKFVKGSSRLNGKKVADPKGSKAVTYDSLDLTANSEVVISYMLVVGSGVTQGEYTNTAMALNALTGKVSSNIAEATVTVTADPLFDNALIFGKVYVDRNGNGVQDEGEEGLGGVKLVTTRGEIITTDTHGRYHIVGVSGGRWERGANFVIKLDPRSLPKEYKVSGRNPKVVRVSPGLPSKVDFGVTEVNQ